MRDSTRPSSLGSHKEGVPPPKKTLTRRAVPSVLTRRSSSAITEFAYAAWGRDGRSAATLRKSQYGHFLRHHGKCTYTPRSVAALAVVLGVAGEVLVTSPA
jgi:hypothetical protein